MFSFLALFSDVTAWREKGTVPGQQLRPLEQLRQPFDLGLSLANDEHLMAIAHLVDFIADLHKLYEQACVVHFPGRVVPAVFELRYKAVSPPVTTWLVLGSNGRDRLYCTFQDESSLSESLRSAEALSEGLNNRPEGDFGRMFGGVSDRATERLPSGAILQAVVKPRGGSKATFDATLVVYLDRSKEKLPS